MLSARLLTAPGSAGVALVRVEGPSARERLALCWPGLARLGPGELGLVRLERAGELLDEALVAVLGPDCVELGLHASPAVVEAVLAALADPELAGAPGPGAAEASLEAAARRALARADTEAAARILLDQAEGALRRGLGELARQEGEAFERARAELERRAREFDFLARPASVVLAGPVNAGKSTLFNALVGAERAVVSAVPGTTRDVVRERARLGAWPVELCDTAGWRPLAAGEDPVERAGQRVGARAALAAELVLWLDPAGRGPEGGGAGAPAGGPRGGQRLVVIQSRAAAALAAGAPALAALERPAEAARVVELAFRSAFDLPAEPWTSGAATPFEPAHLEWIAELAELDPGERGAWLERLLARAG